MGLRYFLWGIGGWVEGYKFVMYFIEFSRI